MRSLLSTVHGIGSLVFITLFVTALSARTVDFQDVVWAEGQSVVTGPAVMTTTQPGAFDSEDAVGFLESGGVEFINRSSITYPGTWNGFAFSNRTEKEIPGFTSGTSSFTGGGFGEGANYAIVYDSVRPAEATTIEQLQQVPFLDLPDGHRAVSARVTNTTYSAFSMLKGDMFAKKFGGESGTDPDYLLLTISGSSLDGAVLGDTVEVYLADYRFSETAQDHVLGEFGEWAHVDLSPLAAADRLYFHFESTDGVGLFTNTPTYMALDDLEIQATGDFDGDGQLTLVDMDLFCSSVPSGSNLQFDLNEDGIVSIGDVSSMLEMANRLSGDADFDGEVELKDFLVLADNFGEASNWSGGDFDCDGEIQFNDFLALAENFGQSIVANAAAASVPEPSAGTLLLLSICITSLLVRQRCVLR